VEPFAGSLDHPGAHAPFHFVRAHAERRRGAFDLMTERVTLETESADGLVLVTKATEQQRGSATEERELTGHGDLNRQWDV
jgi:hypothetical protein